MTDPRYDQQLSDPVRRYPEGSGGMWGWIAGVGVLVLIAIVLIAGWNSHTNTASNAPSATVGSATTPHLKGPMATTPPASTTGSGAAGIHALLPAKPAAPAKPGTQ
jgi:hypothetical protein